MLPSASMSALTNPESKLPPQGIVRNAAAGLTAGAASCSCCMEGKSRIEKGAALAEPTATANGDGKSDDRVLHDDAVVMMMIGWDRVVVGGRFC
mmetsp:Transcript_47727/g.53400  ORF Transcript_47727/g.53400 Transcript_47727/m.53400 type:complete len:94 (-) Transcript_47727:87-368(-)